MGEEAETVALATSGDLEPNTPKSPRAWWLAAAGCGVVLIQVVYGLLVFGFLGQMDVRGQFGDIFGGVNALFTGLAFAGVIYTILLQRRELELQRQELRLNRAELSRSAQAQMDQVSRLEEAADLSAITTLVNIYGSLLAPFWESTLSIHQEIARLEYMEDEPGVSDQEAKSYRAQRRQLNQTLSTDESKWAETLQKH